MYYLIFLLSAAIARLIFAIALERLLICAEKEEVNSVTEDWIVVTALERVATVSETALTSALIAVVSAVCAAAFTVTFADAALIGSGALVGLTYAVAHAVAAVAAPGAPAIVASPEPVVLAITVKSAPAVALLAGEAEAARPLRSAGPVTETVTSFAAAATPLPKISVTLRLTVP